MKVTLTKENQDQGRETISTCEAETFISKIKSQSTCHTSVPHGNTDVHTRASRE